MSKSFVVTAQKTLTCSLVVLADDPFEAAAGARVYTDRLNGMTDSSPGLTESAWVIDNAVEVPQGGGPVAEQPSGE